MAQSTSHWNEQTGEECTGWGMRSSNPMARINVGNFCRPRICWNLTSLQVQFSVLFRDNTAGLVRFRPRDQWDMEYEKDSNYPVVSCLQMLKRHVGQRSVAWQPSLLAVSPPPSKRIIPNIPTMYYHTHVTWTCCWCIHMNVYVVGRNLLWWWAGSSLWFQLCCSIAHPDLWPPQRRDKNCRLNTKHIIVSVKNFKKWINKTPRNSTHIWKHQFHKVIHNPRLMSFLLFCHWNHFLLCQVLFIFWLF